MSIKTVFCFSILILLTGCSLFRSTQETTYFDFDRSPLANSPNLGILVPQRFASTLPSSTKMIFQFPGNEVKYDMYNNWSQTPQDLVARYFTLYFNNPEKSIPLASAMKYTMDGSIYEFECDTNSKEVVFTIGIILKGKNDSLILAKLYGSKVKMEKLSASDFAGAMSKAVDNVAIQIQEDILELNK